MNIAIVGMGISGSSVLKHLFDLDLVDEDVTIDIYEPFEEPIVGKAYRHDSAVLLMNSYSRRLSLRDGHPNDFVDWLEDHHPEYAQDDFAPRHVYGEYLVDFYGDYLNKPQVTLYQEEVTCLTILTGDTQVVANNQAEISQTYGLATQNHPQLKIYDVVFLTIGHLPYADPYNLRGATHFVHTPYPVHDQLSPLDATQRIGIIGSGLTGLDVMHYLQASKDLTHPVTFYIRHEPFTNVKSQLYQGDLVLSFDTDWIRTHRSTQDGQIPLQMIWQQIVEDMTANGVDLFQVIEKYQAGTVFNMRLEMAENPRDLQIVQRYIGLFTAYLPELNMALSPQDRARYHRDYKRIFEHFRTQFPSVKMALILQWLDQNKIKIITGLQSVESHEGGGFTLRTNVGKEYHCDILVNATGFENNLEKAAQLSPLIDALYRQEIITQSPLGGIQVTWPYAHPISPRYGEIKGIFVSGLAISTTQYGNNNAQMTAKHGKDMVTYLKDQLG